MALAGAGVLTTTGPGREGGCGCATKEKCPLGRRTAELVREVLAARTDGPRQREEDPGRRRRPLGPPGDRDGEAVVLHLDGGGDRRDDQWGG
jgi:hypothetical protein